MGIRARFLKLIHILYQECHSIYFLLKNCPQNIIFSVTSISLILLFIQSSSRCFPKDCWIRYIAYSISLSSETPNSAPISIAPSTKVSYIFTNSFWIMYFIKSHVKTTTKSTLLRNNIYKICYCFICNIKFFKLFPH